MFGDGRRCIMKKIHESNISGLKLFHDIPGRYLCEIVLQSGQIQRPTWRGLYRYWHYAKSDEVEYMAASHTGQYVVFCMTVASGQGGIVAVWNARKRRWEHVSEANYVACAMLIRDIPAILSFHYIACWGVPGHHSLYATPLNRTLDGYVESSLPVPASYSKNEFDPGCVNVGQAAYGDYSENNHGPLGVFLLEDNQTVLAHDCGNLYQSSVDEVRKVLESVTQQAEQGAPADADQPRG